MYKRIALFVICIALFSGCTGKGAQKTPPRMLEDIPLTTLDNQSVSLHKFLNTPLVIKSWATTCPFCADELPLFANIQTEFGEQVRIIAINRKEEIARAKKMTDSLNITNRLTFLFDPEDAFYTSIDGFTMPETIFVTSDGEITFHKRGPLSEGELKAQIEKLLEQENN